MSELRAPRGPQWCKVAIRPGVIGPVVAAVDVFTRWKMVLRMDGECQTHHCLDLGGR